MVVVGLADWCRIRTAGAQVAYMSDFDDSGIVQRTGLVFEGRMLVQD